MEVEIFEVLIEYYFALRTAQGSEAEQTQKVYALIVGLYKEAIEK